MLSVAQGVLLRMESDVGRVFLAVFTIPIIARMCGFPVTKLIIAHNVACSAAMLFICIYVLNRVPALLLSIRRGYRQLRAILIVRGIAIGAVTVWRRLRIAELLTSAYLTMFCVRMYVEVSENDRHMGETFSIMMSAIAECTSTPLSLLALALTVSCACKLIVKAAQWTVGGVHDERHVLAHGGCTEALTLVLLCFQIGILGMRIEQKVFLLGLVLFIVMSALLQSLYEILEPQMLALGAMPSAPRSRHIRTISLAGILILGPIVLSGSIASFLPIDLWCVIIVSNCVLTSIRSVSTTIVYSLTLIDNRAAEPWERYDDFVFYTRITTRCVELLLALGVVVYGIVAALNKQWTVASIVVLIFHTYFNVWRRVHNAVSMVKARHTATRNIDSLDKATKSQLEQRKDICPICFMDLIEEARITPCRHLFHGACLRKAS
uniref:RING-type domain-containing protein n=1 Tax=Steinernema glaseri TaxID=37863 RepID=A0A1I7YDF9_9BILA